MSDQRVAYRYAKALIELAEEQKSIDNVYSDMVLFSETCEQNRDFRMMLSNPVISHDKKLKILKGVFDKKVTKITNSYIEIITRKNRESILEATAKEYIRLFNLKKGVEQVDLTTTYPLDAKERKAFQAAAEKLTGKQVVIKEKVDKNIIGGYILRINDQQIDESVKSKLNEVKYRFS